MIRANLHERRVGLMVALLSAQFLVMLDSSLLNVALPSIAADITAGPTGTAWLLAAYFLPFGGLLLVSGRAADVLGRRRMILAGGTVLLAGSVLGALAPGMWALLAARVLQGVGAAALTPAATSMILARFTGCERTRMLSWWGAASTVGGALGVTAGGVLTASIGWRGALWAAAFAATGVLLVSAASIPGDIPGPRRRFDLPGALLVTCSAVAVAGAALLAPHAGIISPGVAGLLLVAAAAVAVLVRVESRSDDPVLPIGLLRDIRLSGSLVVNLLGGAARIACFALVALLIQQVLLTSPSEAGLMMLPTSLAGLLVSAFVLPWLVNRIGPERVAVRGLLLLVVAQALLARIEPGADYATRVLPALLVAAAGVALSFTPHDDDHRREPLRRTRRRRLGSRLGVGPARRRDRSRRVRRRGRRGARVSDRTGGVRHRRRRRPRGRAQHRRSTGGVGSRRGMHLVAERLRPPAGELAAPPRRADRARRRGARGTGTAR